MDELVCLRDLLHDFKYKLLAVASVGIEALISSWIVVGAGHSCSSSRSLSTSCRLLTHKGTVGENTLLADAVGHEHLQKVIRYLVKLLDLLDVRPYDCLLLFEYADSAIHFDIHQSSEKSGKSLD